MRWGLVLAVLIGASVPARADETDDALAKKMAGLVRDFRQPLAARVEATRTLAKLGPRAAAAVPELVSVLDRIRGTEQTPLQEAIIEALGQMGSAARVALPSLAKATQRTIDIDLAIKNSTELILTASDSQDVDALVQQLQSRDASLRMRAAKALGDLGPGARSAVPGLLAALQDPDGDTRRAVVSALRLIVPNAPPNDAFIRAIAADLGNPDPNLRLLAARTLGSFGPLAAAAAADLSALRNDPDPDVRRAAAFAFARVTAVP
jgi:HEAT repeat protein